MIPYARGVRLGRRGRRPLRIYANHTRVRNHHAARGWNPAPTGLAKARPESNPNACGVSPFPQRLLEEMRPFSASTTSVDNVIKCRPYGAAASLFSIVSRDGHPCTIKRSKPSRAQTSDRTTRVRGRGGWGAAGQMGADAQQKAAFLWGSTPFLLVRAKEMGWNTTLSRLPARINA